MNITSYKYAVITSEGYRMFEEPIAALQYAVYMESVGSDSVFYLGYEIDGKAKLIKRLSVYDIKKAVKGERNV